MDQRIPESRSENKFNAERLRDTISLVLREYAEALIIAIFLAIIIRSFVVSAYKVPTGSMIPSLKVGDFIFGYKLPFGINNPISKNKIWQGQGPRRGEVVIFKCPKSPGTRCVKRVVGLPGDRIQIVKKRLFINSRRANYIEGSNQIIKDVPNSEYYAVVNESIFGRSRKIVISGDVKNENFGPAIVPPGHFFVLGDNRDSADDSRFWGAIPNEDLEARVMFVWLSLDWHKTWADDRLPSLRWDRIFHWVQ